MIDVTNTNENCRMRGLSSPNDFSRKKFEQSGSIYFGSIPIQSTLQTSNPVTKDYITRLCCKRSHRTLI